jgi:hypothetical protein
LGQPVIRVVCRFWPDKTDAVMTLTVREAKRYGLEAAQ